jgi:predicted RNA-binding protein associated with RNAse of E/G family
LCHNCCYSGWWYCDLVRVVDEGDVVHVYDDWIDVIVGPGDHPYRVLDLDEFGQGLRDGMLSPAEAAAGLARTQAFLDRHLNRRHGAEQIWPDFPPRSIEPLIGAEFPRAWSTVAG